MLRLLAAALAATLAFPACAEPGFAEVASLPMEKASAMPAAGACVLPAPRGSAGPVVPAAGPAMTLSPRMLQAIRVEARMPAD